MATVKQKKNMACAAFDQGLQAGWEDHIPAIVHEGGSYISFDDPEYPIKDKIKCPYKTGSVNAKLWEAGYHQSVIYAERDLSLRILATKAFSLKLMIDQLVKNNVDFKPDGVYENAVITKDTLVPTDNLLEIKRIASELPYIYQEGR
jgi:hypothetical protein